MRTYCQRTVGAFISGNIHLSDGDASAISARDAGTQTFLWGWFEDGRGNNRRDGPIFQKRTKAEVKEARMKLQEEDRQRLNDFCDKLDALQKTVEDAYPTDF